MYKAETRVCPYCGATFDPNVPAPGYKHFKRRKYCTREHQRLATEKRGLRRSFAAHEVEAISNDYKNGMSCPLLSEKYGVSQSTIYRTLKRAGVETRPVEENGNKPMLGGRLQRLAYDMCEVGNISQSVVAELLGVPRTAVRSACEREREVMANDA